MKMFKPSLRNRFFFSLIILVFSASILIAGVTLYQYKDEAKKYQREKLEQKLASITASINYQIEHTTYAIETGNIPLIFRNKIYEISHIHDTRINFYNLKGHLLKSSKATFLRHRKHEAIPSDVLQELKFSVGDHLVIRDYKENGEKYRSAYTYITNRYFKPLAILNLPHIKSDGFIERKLHEFLMILGQVYLLLILGAVVLSYFFSRYITKSLNTVSEKIYTTRIDQRNQRIPEEKVPQEITGLIRAYNNMVDELEASAVKLATNERERAWRDMAKQVAHEVKNPLTPMRLSIQSFERYFDPTDKHSRRELNEFCQSLIQQIDTMSAIASAFSDFAGMPKARKEKLNVVEVVKLALDIFDEDHIAFSASQDQIVTLIDRTQLIRVVTNLVKNATQAIDDQKANPRIEVRVQKKADQVWISVEDNGEGIAEANKNRIFEPKFTTKTSGMGLGLGIIKKIIESYNGEITVESVRGQGTTFTACFPIKT